MDGLENGWFYGVHHIDSTFAWFLSVVVPFQSLTVSCPFLCGFFETTSQDDGSQPKIHNDGMDDGI